VGKIGSKHSSRLVSFILNVSECFDPKSQISMLEYNFGEGQLSTGSLFRTITTRAVRSCPPTDGTV